MLTIICGLPRAGKTALMTAMALSYMRGSFAHTALRNAQKEIDRFVDGGFKKLSIKKCSHLVFSDYPIVSNKYQNIVSYNVDGFYFGLPNEQNHPTQFIPPYSQIFLDECQRYFNSRESSRFPDFVSRCIELHGHMHWDLFLVAQRPGLIDKNIREVAKRVIYIKDMQVIRKDGIVARCIWSGLEFDSAERAISYIESGFATKLKGKLFRYVYEGNVFMCYDSFGHFGAFYKDRENAHFDITDSEVYAQTVKGVKRYNETHEVSAPDTFYKRRQK